MTWERVPLGDLGQWFGGATPSKGNLQFWTDGSIPWLSPKDMGPMVLAGTRDHITPDAVVGSSVRLVPANSVAVVVRSGILERTLPVASVPFPTTLNQDMKAVVPQPGIDPRWVAWGLRAFERDLLRTTRKAGTTVASIEMPRFYRFRLPVPDQAGQRRILEFLAEHLSHLEAAESGIRQGQQRVVAMVAAARQRLLDRSGTAVGSAAIGDLSVVGTGTTPSRSKTRYYEGGEIPWITSGDLSNGVVDEARQFVTEAAVAETSLRLYPPGTLLVAMYGEGKTRGTVAELRIPATINQACAAIQLHDPELTPWVRAVLDANYTTMRRLAAGGVQPNLNLSLVRGIRIPLPGAATRTRALAELQAVLDSANTLNRDLESARSRSASLKRSLLTAAFEGKLTGRHTDAEVIEKLAEA